MSGPYSRIIEAVVKIAENLGGELPETSGNRLADALEVIAEKAKNINTEGGEPEQMPEVH